MRVIKTIILMALFSCVALAQVRILPIDKAKFIAGARFDFLVEIDGEAKFSELKVSINGKDAAQFFGKKPQNFFKDGVSAYRIDGVSFTQKGEFEVLASYGKEKSAVKYQVVQEFASKKAKNVILLIGDGMSLQAKQMARILSKDINEGKYNGYLEMENMPHLALVTTSGYDSLTTDSANSASAYATGHKSVVNAMGVYEDSTKDAMDDPKVENIAEILKRTQGKSIGLVSTANIADATPAAMITHTRRRAKQNEIALDFLRVKPEVVLGGGLRHFIPQDEPNSKRKDDKNLINLFKEAGYSVSFDKNELLAQRGAKRLLGLYNVDNMNVYLDREVLKNPEVLGKFNAEPNLMQMTQMALDTLSQNPKGFFLMVEGASIDKQLHKMDWQRATYDTIELDKAVKIAKDFAKKRNDTLVIVVADHAHGASITGTYHEKDGKSGREAVRTYDKSVFPSFEDKDKDGFPDSPNVDITLAVQWANHPDYKAYYGFRQKPSSPTIEKNGKFVANPKLNGEEYKGNIPYDEDTEVHSADDVVLSAYGVGAEAFHSIMDNTEVFFAMMRALGVRAN